jgi:hypothetical protein
LSHGSVKRTFAKILFWLKCNSRALLSDSRKWPCRLWRRLAIPQPAHRVVLRRVGERASHAFLCSDEGPFLMNRRECTHALPFVHHTRFSCFTVRPAPRFDILSVAVDGRSFPAPKNALSRKLFLPCSSLPKRNAILSLKNPFFCHSRENGNPGNSKSVGLPLPDCAGTGFIHRR